MKILNLYSGIGGNRKLWGDSHEIVAIEIEKEIARVYKENYPNDKVIICDAHDFLLKNFQEFDFIWSSPPCPTHSIIRKNTSYGRGQSLPIFPDLKLYEEIIFLKHYFKGKWVVENVKSYYKPLITPHEVQRHYFWSNFYISPIEIPPDNISAGTIAFWEDKHSISLDEFSVDKRVVLRNCVDSKLGLHILNMALKDMQQKLVF